MRIVVTGSEGSLMKATIPYLLSQGHDVVGVDNQFRYGKTQRMRDYDFRDGDLTDMKFALEILKGADLVIQAAARIYGVAGFHKYQADILSHDVTLHQNILWAAIHHGVPKVVYISSSMVYERVDGTSCVESNLSEAKIPHTSYGLSKLVGERLSESFAAQYGLTYTVWRPFNIITPFEPHSSEQGISHVFSDFIRMISLERLNPLPMIGDGNQVRCFTWIEDVAGAIAEHSPRQLTNNETYNLGNPVPVSMKELATIIYDEAKLMSTIPRDARPLEFTESETYVDDVRSRVPDIAKAMQQLGFHPTKSLRESIRECLSVAHNLGNGAK